jgi:hypothetical protein
MGFATGLEGFWPDLHLCMALKMGGLHKNQTCPVESIMPEFHLMNILPENIKRRIARLIPIHLGLTTGYHLRSS